MLRLLLLDQLGAVGLGNLILTLGRVLVLVVLPLGFLLYFWVHYRKVQKRRPASLFQRTAEETRAHLERRKRYLRVVAVLLLVLVLFASYQG